MRRHRINVVGASGSGATTTGKALAQALKLPYFDGDDFYHGPSNPPFQNPRPPVERHAMIMAELDPAPSWVLGGGLVGWDPYPELGLTCIVFLWIPLELRLERLVAREKERFGERIEKGGDMYDTHREFVLWASRYDIGDVEGKTLARHEAWMAQQPCPVIEFRQPASTGAIVATVLGSL